MLDLVRLRVFREVAARRSFSAAADALDYTQSAVSQAIAKLERDVGLVLVDRARRPIGLTEAGRVLLERSDRIFGEVATAEAELAALAGLEAGTLRVGAFASACATVVPQAIRDFAARHPGVQVTLAEMEPLLARPRLRAGEIDLAVTYAFDDDGPPEGVDGLERTAVGRDPFVLALPERHPLASRRAVPMAALRDEPWVGAPADGASAGYRRFVVERCRAAGFDPRIAFEPADLWTGRGIVAAGLAVSLMPRLAFTVAYPGVAVRPLEGDAPVRTILAEHLPARRVPGVPALVAALAGALGHG